MPLLDNHILDKYFDETNIPHLDSAQQTVLVRARHLEQRDRALIHLMVQGTLSRRQIGALLNMSAGTVCRRIRRIVNRLHDPLVVTLLDERWPLPQDHRQLGIEHFLQGQTEQDLAERHRLSIHQVRKRLAYVRGWHRGVMARRG